VVGKLPAQGGNAAIGGPIGAPPKEAQVLLLPLRKPQDVKLRLLVGNVKGIRRLALR